MNEEKKSMPTVFTSKSATPIRFPSEENHEASTTSSSLSSSASSASQLSDSSSSSSTSSTQSTATTGLRHKWNYCHNPYSNLASIGATHRRLLGVVPFVQYPRRVLEHPQATQQPLEGGQVRVFLGQVSSKNTTKAALQWIFSSFAGTHLALLERTRVSAGCVHANISAAALDRVIELLHKRVLIDRGGVFVARTLEQKQRLAAYIAEIRSHSGGETFPDLATESLVVEVAKSSCRRSRVPPQQPSQAGRGAASWSPQQPKKQATNALAGASATMHSHHQRQQHQHQPHVMPMTLAGPQVSPQVVYLAAAAPPPSFFMVPTPEKTMTRTMY